MQLVEFDLFDRFSGVVNALREFAATFVEVVEVSGKVQNVFFLFGKFDIFFVRRGLISSMLALMVWIL